MLALLLPSLWMALAWILPVGGTSGIYQVLFWLGVVITVLGMPALAAFMVRVLIPTAERLQGREKFAAIGVVAFVMLTSFLDRHPAPADADVRGLHHQRQLRTRELLPGHRQHRALTSVQGW